MKSKLLTGEELTGLRYLNDEAETLKRKAGYLIQSLVDVFGNGHSVGGLPEMSITQSDGPRVLATLASRFGTGRLVIVFRTEGKIAKAKLIVERSILDQRDREIWEPVMTIQLPKPDWVMDGEPLSDSDKAFVLGASILHAIINGAGSSN